MIPLPGLIIRILLVFFGSVMLLFGMYQLMVPRANFINSTPAPGVELAALPESVAVSFSDELAPESTIAVGSTITLSPSGEKVYSDGKKFTARGPDPGDPQHRTLRVVLEPGLPRGLYWVEWMAVAARGKSMRFGRFCFGPACRCRRTSHVTRRAGSGSGTTSGGVIGPRFWRACCCSDSVCCCRE